MRESLAGRVFGEFTLFKRLAKKMWQMNTSSKGLLIVTTTLVWRITDDSPTFYLLNIPAIR